jgi:hypothetical protein
MGINGSSTQTAVLAPRARLLSAISNASITAGYVGLSFAPRAHAIAFPQLAE